MPFKTMYGCVFIVRELVQYLDVSLLLIISPPLRPAGIEVDSEHCHLLYSIRSCTPIQHLLFITYHAIIKGWWSLALPIQNVCLRLQIVLSPSTDERHTNPVILILRAWAVWNWAIFSSDFARDGIVIANSVVMGILLRDLKSKNGKFYPPESVTEVIYIQLVRSLTQTFGSVLFPILITSRICVGQS